MLVGGRGVAAFAAAVCLSVPAAAMPHEPAFAGTDHGFAQPALFVGATYRLPFGKSEGAAKGRVALKVAGSSYNPASGQRQIGSGLEIVPGKQGPAQISIGGRQLAAQGMPHRLNTGEKILIVAGVILVVALVIVLSEGAVGFPDTAP